MFRMYCPFDLRARERYYFGVSEDTGEDRQTPSISTVAGLRLICPARSRSKWLASPKIGDANLNQGKIVKTPKLSQMSW